MTVGEIREQAKTLGIKQSAKMRKGDLIRAIQNSEGNHGCFGAKWRMECAEEQCCWRGDCQTASPG